MKLLTLVTSLSIGSISYAQIDSINQINADGKKNGYWMVYLDTFMQETDSADAYFYGYDLYDNGEIVYCYSRRGEAWRKRCTLEYSGVLPEKGKPVLINGTLKFFENGRLVSLEIYKDGNPLFWEAYTYGKNDTLRAGFIETFYFDKLYNNIPGTYYLTYTSNFNDGSSMIAEYWYRKGKKGWKAYKIK